MNMTLTLTSSPAVTSLCPNCGIGLPSDHGQIALAAQKQIEDLQAQVRLLTQKATAAVDKWADYEDELRALRAQQTQKPEVVRSESSPSGYLPTQNRFSSFLLSRKTPPNFDTPQSPSTPSERDLVAALNREQTLRQQAEGKLEEASGELEELSAQLFQQANEMVAVERKARAKLEERVEVLERRDVEKRKRLERLENAMVRIERVRGLLAPGPK
ncbi:MAG: hypothetical protein M1818_006862 [Claussenomyces sp. TS43310]|nr:MAG: hypothetical protein M1818_006862 [Claussenomyces sp. TS43310]